MQRPTRENIDRQIRATLVLYGYPVDRFVAGVPCFDEFHEQLIVDHANELDRLWALAENVERELVAAGIAFDVNAEPALAAPFDPHDPYESIGGEA